MISVLVESAVRSLAFAAAVGLVLRLGRVRDVGARLAAWTCVLYGALLLPVAAPLLPPLAVPVLHRASSGKVAIIPTVVSLPVRATEISRAEPPSRLDWRTASIGLYLMIAAGLLCRLGFGLAVTRRLRRASLPVTNSDVLTLLGLQSGLAGIGQPPALAESAALAVPITVGWIRPCITFPGGWREWDHAKLRVVLAHELSHIRRGDYATLLLASFYRCVFWFHPLAWWLDRHLRELAEQASDDSALRGTVDRTEYADVLLGFFEALQDRRGRVRWQGVAMARGTRAGRRIDRILAPNFSLSTPARWPVIAGLALLCVPLFYLSGALQPVAFAQPAPPAPPASPASPPPEPPAPPPSRSHEKWRDSYMVVSGDTITMSGSSEDMRQATELRSKIGDDFIWFRRGGKAYVIRDQTTLKAAHKLFQPQEALGNRQGELGDQQAKLGELQAKIGEQQSGIRTNVPDLTREIEKLKEKLKTAGTSEELGDIQALLGEMQAKVGEQQAHVGDQQAKLGEEQAKLGEEQAKLGEQQAKLGKQQARLAEEASRQLKTLIDEAFKKGLVEPAPR